MAYVRPDDPGALSFDEQVTAYQQAQMAYNTAAPFSQDESNSQATMSLLASNPAVVSAANVNNTPTTIPGNLTPPPASSYVPTDPSTGVPLSTSGGSAPSTGQIVDNSQGQTQSQPTSVAPPSTTGGVAILCARGTTLLTNLGNSSVSQTTGFYAIEEWVRFPNTTTAINTTNSIQQATILAPVLFTGVTINNRDVFSQTLCMNNIKVFYTFGQNFGDLTITGEILLGNFGDKLIANQTVKAFADFFWKYRVSNYLYPVTISAVNEKYQAYLVGMDFGDIIPDVHIMPFVLHGVLLDVSRNSADTVNPSNAVITLTNAGLYNSSVVAALSQTTSVSTTVSPASGATSVGSSFSPPTANPANAASNVSQPGSALPTTTNPLAPSANTGGNASTLSGQALLVANPNLAKTPAGLQLLAANQAQVDAAANGTQADQDAAKVNVDKATIAVQQVNAATVAQAQSNQRIAAFKYPGAAINAPAEDDSDIPVTTVDTVGSGGLMFE